MTTSGGEKDVGEPIIHPLKQALEDYVVSGVVRNTDQLDAESRSGVSQVLWLPLQSIYIVFMIVLASDFLLLEWGYDLPNTFYGSTILVIGSVYLAASDIVDKSSELGYEFIIDVNWNEIDHLRYRVSGALLISVGFLIQLLLEVLLFITPNFRIGFPALLLYVSLSVIPTVNPRDLRQGAKNSVVLGGAVVSVGGIGFFFGEYFYTFLGVQGPIGQLGLMIGLIAGVLAVQAYVLVVLLSPIAKAAARVIAISFQSVINAVRHIKTELFDDTRRETVDGESPEDAQSEGEGWLSVQIFDTDGTLVNDQPEE